MLSTLSQTTLLWAALLPLIAQDACLAQATKALAYEVFKGTASPSGRYALAWRAPHEKIDFARFQSDETYRDSRHVWDDGAQNLVVEQRTRRLVTVVRDAHHLPGANHSDIEALWSKDETAVVVTYGGKWEPWAVTLVADLGSHPAQMDLGTPAREKAMEMLHSLRLKAFKHPSFDVAVEISVKSVTRWSVVLVASPYITKADDSPHPNFRLTYRILRGKHPRLRLVASHRDG